MPSYDTPSSPHKYGMVLVVILLLFDLSNQAIAVNLGNFEVHPGNEIYKISSNELYESWGCQRIADKNFIFFAIDKSNQNAKLFVNTHGLVNYNDESLENIPGICHSWDVFNPYQTDTDSFMVVMGCEDSSRVGLGTISILEVGNSPE